MTIRLKADGRVIPNAHWFGFHCWARAWLGDHRTGGWGHWSSREFDVIDQ